MKFRVIVTCICLIVLSIFSSRIEAVTGYDLSVTVNGSGNVTSTPAGISCTNDTVVGPKTCSHMFYEGDLVGLLATPIDGDEYTSSFIEWTGDCSGSGLCLLDMQSDKMVSADFGALGLPIFALPVPVGQNNYTYLPVENPLENPDPSDCKPFAVGNVGGGTLSLQVGLPMFSNDIDVYLGIYAPALSPELWVVKSDNTLQPASVGIEKWIAGTGGPVSENLFGDIDISTLPAGIYYLYIAVTPAGSQADWNVWQTYFVIL